jgi:hypothetical protein
LLRRSGGRDILLLGSILRRSGRWRGRGKGLVVVVFVCLFEFVACECAAEST